MKGDEAVGILVVFALVGLLVGFATATYAPEIVGIGNALTTFVSALAGAWGAFQFEKYRARARERHDQAQAGNRILLDLTHMWEDYCLYEDDALTGLEGVPNELHWVALRPLLRPPPAADVLDAARLEFMLGTDGAQLVSELGLHRNRYYTYIHLVARHFHLHTDRMQSRFELHGLDPEIGASLQQLRAAVGGTLFFQIRDLVEAIKIFVPRDKADSAHYLRRLHAWLVTNYKADGHKFVNVASKRFDRDAAAGSVPVLDDPDLVNAID